MLFATSLLLWQLCRTLLLTLLSSLPEEAMNLNHSVLGYFSDHSVFHRSRSLKRCVDYLFVKLHFLGG